MAVCVIIYHENEPGPPSWGNGHTTIGIFADALNSDHFIYSMNVKFSVTTPDPHALLLLDVHPDFIKLYNLETKNIYELGTEKHEAYFEARGLDQPKNCSLQLLLFWTLFDQNDYDHQVTVSLECVYFDGASYRKVSMQISLEVLTG